MQDIKDFLNDKLGFNDQCYIDFIRCLKRVEYKKDEFLIRQDDICSFVGFVETGVFRSFILKDGNEFNVDFYLQNSFISAYTSFLTQTPAYGNIQALSDAIIYKIDYNDYNELLDRKPICYKIGKYISDFLFMKKCKRECSLLMDSAIDRYKFLLEEYPTIEQLIPQYHIASYLGIKPESLSRLKHLNIHQ